MLKGLLPGALLGALITAGFALPLGAAGSDLDNDLAAVSKGTASLLDVQSSAGLKIKKRCVCLDAAESTARHKVGIVTSAFTGHTGFNRVSLECWVPRYHVSTGARTSADFCADWIPFGK